MYHYFAIFDAESTASSSSLKEKLSIKLENDHERWQCVSESSDLSIWQSTPSVPGMNSVHISRGGAVLGFIRRSKASHNSYITDSLSITDIPELNGSIVSQLIDKYWGKYVAIYRNPNCTSISIVRDPSGLLPCYVIRSGGLAIIFSYIADVLRVMKLQLSSDDRFLISHIMLPRIQKTVSGLSDVREVLPGECVTIGTQGIQSSFHWNPFDVSESEPLTNRSCAVAELRSSIEFAIEEMIGPHGKLLQCLGGLDSSIVLSCIRHNCMTATIDAVSCFTDSQGGDERRFGRAVTSANEVELIERRLDANSVDLRRVSNFAPSVAPMGVFDCTAPAGQLYELAHSRSASALVYGVGGDNVFFQTPSILSALDYARNPADLSKLAQVVVEASRYGRQSIPRVLRAMLRERMHPASNFSSIYGLIAPSARWPFLAKDIVRAGPDLSVLHPQLQPRRETPKGKYLHIISTAFMAPEYYDAWSDGYSIERIFPLLSQPVVETCLRIPTWNFVARGVDRGLARLAFSDILPSEVVRRTSKSNPSELYDEIFLRNVDWLREVLLDGHLAKRGLIDRKAIESALSEVHPLPRGIAPVLLEFYSWEMWLSHWY